MHFSRINTHVKFIQFISNQNSTRRYIHKLCQWRSNLVLKLIWFLRSHSLTKEKKQRQLCFGIVHSSSPRPGELVIIERLFATRKPRITGGLQRENVPAKRKKKEVTDLTRVLVCSCSEAIFPQIPPSLIEKGVLYWCNIPNFVVYRKLF